MADARFKSLEQPDGEVDSTHVLQGLEGEWDLAAFVADSESP